jgi:hypothetical protein
MEIEELLRFRKALWEELDAIAKAKGKDYSGTVGDTLKNIRLSELYKVPAEIGLMVRIGDKYSRAFELLMRDWQGGDGPAVKEEVVEDTLKDLINYTSYILAVRAEKKGNLYKTSKQGI